MKKLLLKIFLMMGVSMILVFGLSRISLFVLQKQNISDPIVSYHISLLSGALGLVVFAVLLHFFVGRRLKMISMAVNAVANGKIDTKISMKGADEISQLSYDFNRMIEGLRSNEYLNREFVKNVSHEFKTPLSIITGYSNLLRSESLTEAERKEYAGYIFQEANRLNNLSGKLLAISRLDANHYNTSFEHFFIDEQIRSVILSMQLAWSQKRLNVEAEMDKIKYCSNQDLCYLIWQNLISNAVKYTKEGGDINLKLHTEDSWVVFTITNSGNSLQGKEDLIFQPFYTSDASGQEKGTGLGLPLVKKVLDKLGGKIEVKCLENTQFIVKLPMQDQENERSFTENNR